LARSEAARDAGVDELARHVTRWVVREFRRRFG
jgi:hypothetical protein